MKKVLFVCIHNSARSQMAEAYVNEFAPDILTAESAGLEKGTLNPDVVKVMAEEGIDISAAESNSVQEFLAENRSYDYVITVCDEGNAEGCPVFPGGGEKLHWSFPDPSTFKGADKLEQTREVRNMIKDRVLGWLSSFRC